MIQELGKNKYKLIVNISENGKRIARRTKTVNCGKREANRLYQQFEDEVKRTFSRDSVEEMIDAYINAQANKGKVRQSTIDGYIKEKNRIISFLGNKNVAEVSTIHIEQMVAQMQEKLASKTIKNTVGLLNASFSRLVRLGVLQSNPCTNVQLPTVVSAEPKTLDKAERGVFLEALNNLDLDTKVAFELALFMGMRRSEILGLKPSDYDKSDCSISINKGRHMTSKGHTVEEAKTVKSHRTLALPKFLAKDIEELIELHNSYDFVHDDWLILHFDKAIHPSTLTNRMARFRKKCGLNEATLRALRHTCATMLLHSRELDIVQISRQLGHSNTTTTLNIYSHATGGASVSSRQISNILEGFA